jgi:Na+-translocating ferredoxin:NAD+ oxidoreductase RNF subunit RnfB
MGFVDEFFHVFSEGGKELQAVLCILGFSSSRFSTDNNGLIPLIVKELPKTECSESKNVGT